MEIIGLLDYRKATRTPLKAFAGNFLSKDKHAALIPFRQVRLLLFN